MKTSEAIQYVDSEATKAELITATLESIAEEIVELKTVTRGQMETAISTEGFELPEEYPVNSFTQSPTQTNLQPALESLGKAIATAFSNAVKAVAKVLKAILAAISKLFGGKDSRAEALEKDARKELKDFSSNKAAVVDMAKKLKDENKVTVMSGDGTVSKYDLLVAANDKMIRAHWVIANDSEAYMTRAGKRYLEYKDALKLMVRGMDDDAERKLYDKVTDLLKDSDKELDKIARELARYVQVGVSASGHDVVEAFNESVRELDNTIAADQTKELVELYSQGRVGFDDALRSAKDLLLIQQIAKYSDYTNDKDRAKEEDFDNATIGRELRLAIQGLGRLVARDAVTIKRLTDINHRFVKTATKLQGKAKHAVIAMDKDAA